MGYFILPNCWRNSCQLAFIFLGRWLTQVIYRSHIWPECFMVMLCDMALPSIGRFSLFLEVSLSAREAFAPMSCVSTILREADFFFFSFNSPR